MVLCVFSKTVLEKQAQHLCDFCGVYNPRIRHRLEPGKYLGKRKNAKKNDFLMFSTVENIKENQI